MFSCSEQIDSNYTVLTMGTFDGVHLGHQKLLKKVAERAVLQSGKSVVITYYHHPKETLNKDIAPYLLTERHHKEILIKELGIDYVVFLNFDYQMSLISANDFLENIICSRFDVKEIVFGYDCHFGHNREGNYNFLEKNSSFYGYTTLLVEPHKVDGTIVSSSLIRNFISRGLVKEASRFLGRNYELQGNVVEGEKIGRKLGFPTVNLQPVDKLKLIPANGVYVGKTYLGNEDYFCLVNVGVSPTLKTTTEKIIECHLLDYSGNINQNTMKIDFITRIRDEVKFLSIEDLIEAIKKDKEYANDYIKDYLEQRI